MIDGFRDYVFDMSFIDLYNNKVIFREWKLIF